jgi:hypothetical protein
MEGNHNMSQAGKIRIELNLATGLIALSILCISVMTVMGQIEQIEPAAKMLGGMKSEQLLALITILSLGLCSYLIKLLFGKLLKALDENTQANAVLARMLAERPCIRDPRNN